VIGAISRHEPDRPLRRRSSWTEHRM